MELIIAGAIVLGTMTVVILISLFKAVCEFNRAWDRLKGRITEI